ncbi:MAG: hypothetical protein GY884_08090, partial [Proteobacteria bacterium]|nr:hypothetical protein [Pseudomonadota bacterium]
MDGVLTEAEVEELDVLRGYLVVTQDVEELERQRYQRQVVQVEQEYQRIITRCGPRPTEKPSMMYFRFWGDNGFELAQLDPQSTFGVDVDTASYTLARRYLRDGYIPEKAAIRTEEFVNYFEPDLPAPVESTFAIHA